MDGLGNMGFVLRVDLDKGTAKRTKLSKEATSSFLGGRGFGALVLNAEVMPSIDSFDPRNRLVIATGPLTGTGIAAGTKTTVITKSPLTQGVGYALASGKFGSKLKYAGLDAIVVQGRGDKPTYLYVTADSAQLRDASAFMGLSTTATRKKFYDMFGKDASVLCIGPAGENLVRYACIVMDNREAGRTGVGAVMGSKNLKAIVVDTPNLSLPAADPMGLKAAIKRGRDLISNDPACKAYRTIGTSRSCKSGNELGMCPTRNFQASFFEGYEQIIGEVLLDKFVTKHNTCYLCPIMCEKICQVKEGKYAGAVSEGLEYESIFAFGPMCGVNKYEPIIAAGMYCDDYGLDTLSTGGTIAFAMECFERGYLTPTDTGGLPLTFGNDEAMVEAIHLIARRKGFGDLLAEGTKRVAEKIGRGSSDFAMNIKGLEMPGWDPRGAWGMALAYATANRGGCHTTAAVFPAEVSKISGSYGLITPDPNITYWRWSTEGKAELVKYLQDNRALMSALGICYFARPLSVDYYAECLSAVTGKKYDRDSFFRIGERIYNLERLFNIRTGLARKDDTLPKRLFGESSPVGPSAGKVVPLDAFEQMLDEYYLLRKWNREGVPLDKLEMDSSPKLDIS